MRVLVFSMAVFAAGAAHAEPISYTLDPAHTQVAFSIERFGFNNVLGRFDEVAGEVVLDRENPANSSVHAVIQVASVDAGNDTRDEHLRSERWLNASLFPSMEFRSTSVRIIADDRAEVVGNLTLLGQTHPVTLDVRLNRMGALPNNQRQAAGFSATGSLDRSAWGSTTAANLIGDEVRIAIEALAVAAEAAD